jgi:hypothetical protein
MTGDGLFGETEAAFHENVNRTYYQLECQGQLPATMKGRTKQAIRDLHVAAQSKSYWEN